MQVPDTTGLAFLFYVLLLLPYAALRSRRRMGAMPATSAPEADSVRRRIYISTLLMLGVLFYLAWITGRTFNFGMFAGHALGLREWGLGVAALAIAWGIRVVNRRMHSDAELRERKFNIMIPKSSSDLGVYIALAIAAGIAEEAAYRGVGMGLLTWTLGSPWPAAFILAAAFAVGHALQGLKSAVVIGVVALLMHALVALTDTLIIAMVVHATYDIIAGFEGRARLARYAREAAETHPA